MKTKTGKTHKRVARVNAESGNIFADMGFPIPNRNCSGATHPANSHHPQSMRNDQAEIAKILGVQQPQVSLLMRNRAGNFSVAD